jgi:integrase
MGESSNGCPKILEVFDDHNAKMKQLVDVEYSPETLERYVISRKHTQAFIQQKYKVNDIRISDLNYEFITNYEFWLKSVRKCEHNTTMKYLSNFRKIVNICLKNGWINRDPFYGYKMTKRVVDREYLTAEEIQRLISKNFNLERLSQVRDVFLFSCFTGLAFADVYKLNRREIVIGMDGEKWISTNRQKTDSLTRIPLLPQAIRILEKYENHPQCLNKGKLLPVMSNQKMNAYLKEIGDLCEIEKNMTFHMARHTFATTVTLTNGVPIETVSKLLGHRNLKTTQHYAKIIDKKVSDDLKTLKNKIETTGLFG